GKGGPPAPPQALGQRRLPPPPPAQSRARPPPPRSRSPCAARRAGRRCALRAGSRTPARSWGPPGRCRSHRRRGPWPRARAARTAIARRARRRARRRRLRAATQTRIPTTVDGRLRTEDATPMSVLWLASSVVRLRHQTIEQAHDDIAAAENRDRHLALLV